MIKQGIMKQKRKAEYNFLSFIIKFNKSIGISLIVLVSTFFLVYCTSVQDETELALEDIDRLIDKTEMNSQPPAEEKPSRELSDPAPDLRNMISIMQLDYSENTLQGVFWEETDFQSSVYLSFDDGPNLQKVENGEESTTISEHILNTLKKYDLKAVFFINGRNLEYNSPSEKKRISLILLRMINEGHLIGNHSYNHHNLSRGRFADGIDDESDIALEFISTQNSLNDLLGFAYPMLLVRPPYAEPGRTADLDTWLISEKKYLISLQFDSYDYAYDQKGRWNEAALLERMESLLEEQKSGGVILLHELESTALFLDNLIENIILKRGYSIETMESLLSKKYGRQS